MQAEVLPILVADADAAQGAAIGEWLKAWGRPVQLAHDGGQTLGLLMHQRFAAVFLDIHLPLVGGIDATKALRAGQTGGERLPIIGLQTRQDGIDTGKLVEAGMDAVLTKPFSPAQLHAVLIQLLPAVPTGGRPVETPFDHPGEPCLDAAKVAEFTTSDPELFADMVGLLGEEFPRRMQQITAAVRQGDGKALERAAHSLKGALSYFCRKRVLQALHTLERYGREMNFAAAAELQTRLESIFPRLQTELAAPPADPTSAAAINLSLTPIPA